MVKEKCLYLYNDTFKIFKIEGYRNIVFYMTNYQVLDERHKSLFFLFWNEYFEARYCDNTWLGNTWKRKGPEMVWNGFPKTKTIYIIYLRWLRDNGMDDGTRHSCMYYIEREEDEKRIRLDETHEIHMKQKRNPTHDCKKDADNNRCTCNCCHILCPFHNYQ